MKEYTVLPGQSLFDIACTIYGGIEGIFWLIDDNRLNGPTDRILPGDKLKYRSAVVSARVRDYLQGYPIIATIVTADQSEGISFWRLEEYQVQ